MRCFVYKGSKKADHFLYVPNELEILSPPADVPKALLEMLGDLTLVLDFELTEDRELANADAKQVCAALQKNGFYFQMPSDSMYNQEETFFN